LAQSERQMSALSKRLQSPGQAFGQVRPDFMPQPSAVDRARGFLKGVSAAIASSADPVRILFLVDGLDLNTPAHALSWIEHADAALGGNMVMAVAFDASRLCKATPVTEGLRARLDGVFSAVVNVSRIARRAGPLNIVYAVDRSVAARDAQGPEAFAAFSSLGDAFSADEAALLASMAPLAGITPRAAASLVNIYRLLRTGAASKPSAALAAAVAASEDPSHAKLLGARLDAGAPLIGEFSQSAAMQAAATAAQGAAHREIGEQEFRASFDKALSYRWPLDCE
jgi:hypothetical protein